MLAVTNCHRNQANETCLSHPSRVNFKGLLLQSFFIFGISFYIALNLTTELDLSKSLK